MEQTEKLELTVKKLDIKRKKLELIEAEKELTRSDLRMVLDQISQLRNLMTERIIDGENTVFSTEVKYKNVLDDNEMQQVKNRILALVKQFK